MAGLTAQGLITKSLSEIITNINNKCIDEWGSEFSTATNTPEQFWVGIFAAEAADLWQGVQGSYDASFPKSATGVNLANCADRVGIKPIAASNSIVNIQFTGSVGSVIPEGTVVPVEGSGERFETLSSLTLNGTSFTEVIVSVSSVVASTTYAITVNEITSSIISSMSPTAETIVSSLTAQIASTVSGVTITNPTATTIKIVVDDLSSEYGLLVGTRLTIDSLSNIVQSEAVNVGFVEAPVGSLSALLIPVGGVTSLTNKVAATVGRLSETDTELRIRRYQSVAIIGAGTNASITANIRNIDGVIGAFIIENNTGEIDEDGRPLKSYETVVEGGDEEVIANTLELYRPTGIETTGSTVRIVQDSRGNPVVVKFSRPINVYVHIQVEYTRTLEENFPSGGEQSIKSALATYGNALNIGQDIFPDRFKKPIFDSVSGIAATTLRFATSTDGVTVGAYTTQPISVDDKEITLFDVNRITVVEV
jgi:hypothetical protein